jgi:hypothetical protein
MYMQEKYKTMAYLVRTAAALQRTKVLELKSNPDLELTVKKADNRAVIARQNLFDSVRYITEGEEGTTVTERKFPMGELRLETIMLVLQDWNVADEKGNKYPISHKAVTDYLEPSEFMEAYDAIIAMNPVWGGEEGESSGS